LRNVIIENDVQYQLLDLKNNLIESQGDRKGTRTFKEIVSSIDNLGVFDSIGSNLKEKYKINCPDNWYVLYVRMNYFIFSKTDNEVIVLKMYNNKQDFLFHLFGVEMRSQESILYWGE